MKKLWETAQSGAAKVASGWTEATAARPLLQSSAAAPGSNGAQPSSSSAAGAAANQEKQYLRYVRTRSEPTGQRSSA